jgi:mannosyltransferase
MRLLTRESPASRSRLFVAGGHERDRRGAAVAWALAGIVLAGIVVRFASLGLQSYHHDEVITAMRVIPDGFEEMLHRVKTSESTPPLYYVLAWGWAKAFGTDEFGLRSLSALFGAATVPVGYLIGRQLASRRVGLVLAVLIAVNPMLIWYSQEARSYALLVFFGALSLLFFVRALDSRRGRDLGLWAAVSALALCSHYFAVFAVGIEAAWLLVALRDRWRLVLPALAAVGAVGLALLPLIDAQVNPNHIGWIENSPLASRLWETAVSFLIGETGHVIAEAPRDRYALFPIVLVAAAGLLVAVRGERRERRGAAIGLGLGAADRAAAALLGKDYVVERNLLPALVPLSTGGGARLRQCRRAPARAPAGGRPLHLLDRIRRPRHPDAQPATAGLSHRHRGSRAAAGRQAGDRHLEARRRPGSLLPARRGPAYVRW